MPDEDLVLVRRDDLRALIEEVRGESYAPIDANARLLAAVNGEAATVETEWRIAADDDFCDEGYPTERSAHEQARVYDERTEYGPHRVEARITVVGPWTTQETP